jgi:glycosyltransferase involved in cell wall biosynthesis
VWNGMPFFTPLWAKGPRVTFIHHVHDEMWRQALSSRKAQIGEVIELRVAPVLYRNARVLTPSESSRRVIIDKLRLRPDRVSAVPNGIDARFTPGGQRAAEPLVAVIGRLVPHKRVEAVLRAVAEVRKEHPTVEVVVVGDGYDRDRLSTIADELGGWNWVHFVGRVSDDELLAVYRRAWVVASASTAEGWGMAITEAAACGTTAVATRIPGHVDVIADGETGVLIDTDDELAAALGQVIGDRGLRERLAAGALARAATHTWDRAAYEILEALADEAKTRR